MKNKINVRFNWIMGIKDNDYARRKCQEVADKIGEQILFRRSAEDGLAAYLSGDDEAKGKFWDIILKESDEEAGELKNILETHTYKVTVTEEMLWDGAHEVVNCIINVIRDVKHNSKDVTLVVAHRHWPHLVNVWASCYLVDRHFPPLSYRERFIQWVAHILEVHVTFDRSPIMISDNATNDLRKRIENNQALLVDGKWIPVVLKD